MDGDKAWVGYETRQARDMSATRHVAGLRPTGLDQPGRQGLDARQGSDAAKKLPQEP